MTYIKLASLILLLSNYAHSFESERSDLLAAVLSADLNTYTFICSEGALFNQTYDRLISEDPCSNAPITSPGEEQAAIKTVTFNESTNDYTIECIFDLQLKTDLLVSFKNCDPQKNYKKYHNKCSIDYSDNLVCGEREWLASETPAEDFKLYKVEPATENRIALTGPNGESAYEDFRSLGDGGLVIGKPLSKNDEFHLWQNGKLITTNSVKHVGVVPRSLGSFFTINHNGSLEFFKKTGGTYKLIDTPQGIINQRFEHAVYFSDSGNELCGILKNNGILKCFRITSKNDALSAIELSILDESISEKKYENLFVLDHYNLSSKSSHLCLIASDNSYDCVIDLLIKVKSPKLKLNSTALQIVNNFTGPYVDKQGNAEFNLNNIAHLRYASEYPDYFGLNYAQLVNHITKNKVLIDDIKFNYDSNGSTGEDEICYINRADKQPYCRWFSDGRG